MDDDRYTTPDSATSSSSSEESFVTMPERDPSIGAPAESAEELQRRHEARIRTRDELRDAVTQARVEPTEVFRLAAVSAALTAFTDAQMAVVGSGECAFHGGDDVRGHGIRPYIARVPSSAQIQNNVHPP